MSAHTHSWTLVDQALRRYICACGVIGFRRHRSILPYLCQKEVSRGRALREHCAAEATFVTGDRSKSRCSEHAPEIELDARAAAVVGGG